MEGLGRLGIWRVLVFWRVLGYFGVEGFRAGGFWKDLEGLGGFYDFRALEGFRVGGHLG